MDLLSIGVHLASDLGTERFPFKTAIRYINHLPPDSAVARARAGFKPPMETQMLRQIEFWTHLLAYRDTRDAQAKRNIPKPIKLYGDEERKPGARDPKQFEMSIARRMARRQAELDAMK